MVSTFSHEIVHDTDKQTIETLKKRQGGEKVDFEVEGPAYEMTKEVHKEIKENRND